MMPKNVLFQPSSPRYPIKWKFGELEEWEEEKSFDKHHHADGAGDQGGVGGQQQQSRKIEHKTEISFVCLLALFNFSPCCSLRENIVYITQLKERKIRKILCVILTLLYIFLSATTQTEIDSVLIVNLYFYYQTEAKMVLQQQHQRVPFVMSWHNISLKNCGEKSEGRIESQYLMPNKSENEERSKHFRHFHPFHFHFGSNICSLFFGVVHHTAAGDGFISAFG